MGGLCRIGTLATVVGMGAGRDRVSGPWALCRCPTLSNFVGGQGHGLYPGPFDFGGCTRVHDEAW